MSLEHLCDGAVAEEAGRDGHLEGEPVFALANVEDVAGVCGAGYSWHGFEVSRLFCSNFPRSVRILRRLTLELLGCLDFGLGYAKGVAVVDVELHLVEDVGDDCIRLLV